MVNEEPQGDMTGEKVAAASPDGPRHHAPVGPRISRRQAMGRLSAVATAGAAAWVVPEILTAKPAAAAMSGAGDSSTTPPSVVTSASTVGSSPSTGASAGAGGSAGGGDTAETTATPDGSSSTLAFTGVDIQRDAEIGAALVAGGWAMQHWASRTPKPAVSAPPDAPEA